MARPVTLSTGQRADPSISDLAALNWIGYAWPEREA